MCRTGAGLPATCSTAEGACSSITSARAAISKRSLRSKSCWGSSANRWRRLRPEDAPDASLSRQSEERGEPGRGPTRRVACGASSRPREDAPLKSVGGGPAGTVTVNEDATVAIEYPGAYKLVEHPCHTEASLGARCGPRRRVPGDVLYAGSGLPAPRGVEFCRRAVRRAGAATGADPPRPRAPPRPASRGSHRG